MSTYIELVNRAEAAAIAAEQSALNTANNKTIVQGLLEQMQEIVGNTATLPVPSIQVDTSTGIVTAEYTVTAGNVLSRTQRIGTLDISSLLVSGQGIATTFYKCASVSGPYTETYYAVSGAGMSAVNGNYTDTGTTRGGKPVYSYTNSGTTYYLFYDSDWESWFIHTSTSFTGEDVPTIECLYHLSDYEPDSWYTGGGGSGDAPTVTLTTVTHDLPKTWTGYKAVFDAVSGTYDFEATVTSGLTYSTVIPVVGGVYTDGTLIEANLFTGIPTDYVLYHPLSSAEASINGYSCSYSNVTFAQDSSLGETVAVFNGDGQLTISNVAGSPAVAFSIFQKIDEDTEDNQTVVMRDRFGILSTPFFSGVFDFNGNLELQKQYNNTGWKHIYVDYANGATRLFIGGVEVANTTNFTYAYNYTSDVQMGVHFNGSSFPLTGKLKAFRMYNRQLRAAEIAA